MFCRALLYKLHWPLPTRGQNMTSLKVNIEFKFWCYPAYHAPILSVSYGYSKLKRDSCLLFNKGSRTHFSSCITAHPSKKSSIACRCSSWENRWKIVACRLRQGRQGRRLWGKEWWGRTPSSSCRILGNTNHCTSRLTKWNRYMDLHRHTVSWAWVDSAKETWLVMGFWSLGWEDCKILG